MATVFTRDPKWESKVGDWGCRAPRGWEKGFGLNEYRFRDWDEGFRGCRDLRVTVNA